MAVSVYESLGSIDASLRDQVMRQLGVTREMLDSNMSMEEYLRQTGQQDQLRVFESKKQSRFVQRTAQMGYVASDIISKGPASPISRYDARITMSASPDSSDNAIYIPVRNALPALTTAIDSNPIDASVVPTGGRDNIKPLLHAADALLHSGLLGSISGFGGVVEIIAGPKVSKALVAECQKDIDYAYRTYCKTDLKIAAEYRKRNTDSEGSRKLPPAPLTEREKAAFENLWEAMEFNGGSKLFGQKFIAEMGWGTGAAIGGEGAIAGLYASAKLMAAGDGVPTPEALEARWKAMNVGGFVGSAVIDAFFPSAMFFTLAALVSANVMAFKMLKEIAQWHERYADESERANFLYETGAFAEEQMKADLAAYTDQSLRAELQIKAEEAAKAIAKGSGQYTREQVRTLGRYARNAAHWLGGESGDTIANADPVRKRLQARHQAVMQFLSEGQIIENKQSLLARGRAQSISM